MTLPPRELTILAITAIFSWLYLSVARKRRTPPDTSTYRIRGLPLDWNVEKLQDFLADFKAKHPRNGTPILHSLSPEIDNSSKTATLTLNYLPLSAQSQEKNKAILSASFKAKIAPALNVTVDKAFLGITTLYNPPNEDHKLDIIAIHGLGGHAFGAFLDKDSNHMWLRDSLPHDLAWEETGKPMARIMIYGYGSHIPNSESMESIEDLGTKFRQSLSALVKSLAMRPIVLIAHSLGGLIVKEAIMALARSNFDEDRKLVGAIYGLVFFGVPNEGMDITSLRSVVGDGPNRFLVESIGHLNSQILTIQQREFPTAFSAKDRSEVFCFYETQMSPTAKKNKNGEWKMEGPPTFLVTKSSATHCRHWEDGAEHICAISRTHTTMVKFRPHDDDYANVRERLKGLARRALTIQDRIQAGTIFMVPYNENPEFVGRSSILAKLKQRLGLGQPQGLVMPHARVAIYGLGGIGKTQVALAYVYWVRKSLPELTVFWVHASDPQRFYQAYASIAEEFKIPGYDDPKADLLSLVKIWLEKRYKTRWLMVIDNADDTTLFFPPQQGDGSSTTATEIGKANGLGRYIPECRHGSILFTTRDKQAGSRLAQGKPPIKVGEMDDEEVYQLLCGILEDEEISKKDVSALALRLEYLPLALAQAAAFIQENSIPISEYIDLLDKSDSDLVNRLSEPFETVGRDSKTPHAVTAAWIISFDQIKRRNPFNSDVLSFMSFFHRLAIPRAFVVDYCHRIQHKDASQDGAAALTKALGTLKAFSFISEHKEHNMNMHRLVQLVTRKWLDSRRDHFARLALQTMSAIYPYGEFETRDECMKLLPHANSVLKHSVGRVRDERMARAKLLYHMAAYFNHRGPWGVAEEHQNEALEIQRQEEGYNHLDTLASMNNLALTYWNQGRWKEAEKLYTQVVEARKSKLKADHPDTLTSMNSLASVYRDQGRWEEAKRLYIQVVEARKSKLGADHPSTLTSMGNLASVYRDQGRLEEAEKLNIQVVEARKSKLGAEHPDTLTSISNLASVYSDQGRWEEAKKLKLTMVEAFKLKLGADHPYTLASINNLAFCYRNQCQWEEAKKLFIHVVEAFKLKVGDDHPDTLTSMNNLASTYRDQGQWDDAERLHMQVLETRKSKLGTDHPDTLRSMNNVALTYGDQSRWEDAKKLHMQVLETRKAKLGADHPETLITMHHLAFTLQGLGRLDEALGLMHECVALRRRVLGPAHPDTVSSEQAMESWKADNT